MDHATLHGIWPALVTPFRDGNIDTDALTGLACRLMDGGVHGLVALGTTGEAVTQERSERLTTLETVVAAARGRVPVMAGIGGNHTAEVIIEAHQAVDQGADLLLAVTPPYNKPTQAGMLAHFTALADAARKPLVLYNVPSRTGVNLSPETLATLARHPRIAGIKDAAGSIPQFCREYELVPGGFALLSGDDGLFFPLLCLGARGVVSVAANVAPRALVGLYDAFAAGDLARARDLHYRLLPLMDALFVETNPAPVKYALSRLGLMAPDLRLPLAPLAEHSRRAVDEVLDRARDLWS